MNKRHILAISLVMVLAFGGAVMAQISVPQVSTINPTADLMQVIPSGQPGPQSVYATPAQITATRGYYRSAPASLFTYTFGNAVALAAFDPSGTLAYGYVTMAPTPSDGTEACVFSTAAITTLYLTANTGQTLSDAVTTLAANARNCYVYAKSAATWYRSQ
jgi:hypothetical protein